MPESEEPSWFIEHLAPHEPMLRAVRTTFPASGTVPLVERGLWLPMLTAPECSESGISSARQKF